MSIEAMKLAKAWFERNTYGDEAVEEYEALVQAIADAEQQQPVVWEGMTLNKYPEGTPRTIFTSKQKADEWLSGFVSGHAWLEPLSYTTPPRQPEQEPVEAKRLRRGNLLRCIETDELCTVWFTSTTGKTLVKWSANDFGEYTAEQIGELFWLVPEPDDLELAAEKSDNYAAFHAGYRFAMAHNAPPPRKPLTDEEIKIIWRDIDGSEGMLMRFARAIEAALSITKENT